MKRIVCDLCHKDITDDTNITTVVWKDNNGVSFEFGLPFREKRKFKAEICDECIEKLQMAVRPKELESE